jgi:hypothetical protein
MQKQFWKKNGLLSQTLLEDKVIDFLKNNNNIKEVNTTENQETTNTEGE